MDQDELEYLIHYSEVCSRLAEVNVTLSSMGLLSTILIDGKAPAFSIVMCGICGVMLTYNACNMYGIEKTQRKMLTKTNSHK